jgi:hypothetical protein
LGEISETSRKVKVGKFNLELPFFSFLYKMRNDGGRQDEFASIHSKERTR